MLTIEKECIQSSTYFSIAVKTPGIDKNLCKTYRSGINCPVPLTRLLKPLENSTFSSAIGYS